MGVVLKYGGTSVGTIEQIQEVAQHVSNLHRQEKNIIVVVSAMGKSTDHLIQMAKHFGDELPQRELDTLLATGEQQTIALFTMALRKCGSNAISLTGFQAGFKTTNHHTKSIIKDVDVSRILSHLEEGKIVVVAGFQGITEQGDITTLGRGGSDTSAVALAAKLGFSCEIYTDVDGIYTVDPRVYKNAKKLKYLSFSEMMEMASLGAGVIETRSVELASKYNVPLYIARSLSKSGSGTYIMNQNFLFEEKPITGISVTDNVVMITLEGIKNDTLLIASIFGAISQKNINLDMISQTIDNNNNLVISFSIDETDLQDFNQLHKTNTSLFDSCGVKVKTDIIKLSLVGVGMASNFGVASKVFSTLAQNNIPFYHVSTSEISISCTVPNELKSNAVEKLALVFNL